MSFYKISGNDLISIFKPVTKLINSNGQQESVSLPITTYYLQEGQDIGNLFDKKSIPISTSQTVYYETTSSRNLSSLFEPIFSIPIGTILIYTNLSIPTDYLVCDGSSYETEIYNDLFNVINNTYGGSGDSFNVPNLKDKFPVGSNTLNEVGGCNTIKLKSKNMYEHNHNATITMQEHQHEINYTLSGSQVTSYSEKYLTNQAFTSTSLDYLTNERTYPAVHS